MTLREFFSSIRLTPSAWCKMHRITPESILMYLSGIRNSIGLVTATKIYIATEGIVPLDSMVLPEVARAIAELMVFEGTSPHSSQVHYEPARDVAESQSQTLGSYHRLIPGPNV
jgi:hypothetical protein